MFVRHNEYYCPTDGGLVCLDIGNFEPSLQPISNEVLVFNPFAWSYVNTSLPQCERKNELEKCRAHNE